MLAVDSLNCSRVNQIAHTFLCYEIQKKKYLANGVVPRTFYGVESFYYGLHAAAVPSNSMAGNQPWRLHHQGDARSKILYRVMGLHEPRVHKAVGVEHVPHSAKRKRDPSTPEGGMGRPPPQ